MRMIRCFGGRLIPLLREIRHTPLLWLLAFVPVLFVAHKFKPEAHTLHFVLSVLAVVPLAALLVTHRKTQPTRFQLLVAAGTVIALTFIVRSFDAAGRRRVARRAHGSARPPVSRARFWRVVAARTSSTDLRPQLP